MTKIRLHQALYGYSDGHRLITSSMPIDGSVGRDLRSLTDMSFPDHDASFITGRPLPEINAFTLVRSWPAGDDFRPGSVWSHVLLIDYVELGAVDDLSGLLDVFERPRLGPDAPRSAFDRYSHPIDWLASAARRDSDGGSPFEHELLGRVYGAEEPISVKANPTLELDALLLRLWSQQWPRLRRSFSFRTRWKAGAAESFDVEIAARTRQTSIPDQQPRSDWLDTLADDLRRPDPAMRAFLRQYGAESTHGRTDMPRLIDVWSHLASAELVPEVARELSESFPHASEMSKLKLALLGPATEGTSLWDVSEPIRLALALRSGPASLDFATLQVEHRLGELWIETPELAHDLLVTLPAEQAPIEVIRSLAGAMQSGSEPIWQWLYRLASENQELVFKAFSVNPDLLYHPSAWGGESEHLAVIVEMLLRSRSEEASEIFLRLVDGGESRAAARLAEAQPSLWWAGLEAAADATIGPVSIDVLRDVIESIGPAAVGKPPSKMLSNPEALVALAAVVDPSTGMWRHASTKQWIKCAQLVQQNAWVELTSGIQNRVFATTLLSAERVGPDEARAKAWAAAFPSLHDALAVDTVDEISWHMVSQVLPLVNTWDKCALLREGLLRSLGRDEWTQAAQDRILAVLPDEWSNDLRWRLQQNESRNRFGWDLQDFLGRWWRH